MEHRSGANPYIAYYKAQVGGGLNGFRGTAQMGRGIGGIFRSLFRMARPLLRRGVDMAKPHLKTAMKNIASDVVGQVIRSRFNNPEESNTQGGSGIVVLPRGRRLTPPGRRVRRLTGTKARTALRVVTHKRRKRGAQPQTKSAPRTHKKKSRQTIF